MQAAYFQVCEKQTADVETLQSLHRHFKELNKPKNLYVVCGLAIRKALKVWKCEDAEVRKVVSNLCKIREASAGDVINLLTTTGVALRKIPRPLIKESVRRDTELATAFKDALVTLLCCGCVPLLTYGEEARTSIAEGVLAAINDEESQLAVIWVAVEAQKQTTSTSLGSTLLLPMFKQWRTARERGRADDKWKTVSFLVWQAWVAATTTALSVLPELVEDAADYSWASLAALTTLARQVLQAFAQNHRSRDLELLWTRLTANALLLAPLLCLHKGPTEHVLTWTGAALWVLLTKSEGTLKEHCTIAIDIKRFIEKRISGTLEESTRCKLIAVVVGLAGALLDGIIAMLNGSCPSDWTLVLSTLWKCVEMATFVAERSSNKGPPADEAIASAATQRLRRRVFLLSKALRNLVNPSEIKGKELCQCLVLLIAVFSVSVFGSATPLAIPYSSAPDSSKIFTASCQNFWIFDTELLNACPIMRKLKKNPNTIQWIPWDGPVVVADNRHGIPMGRTPMLTATESPLPSRHETQDTANLAASLLINVAAAIERQPHVLLRFDPWFEDAWAPFELLVRLAGLLNDTGRLRDAIRRAADVLGATTDDSQIGFRQRLLGLRLCAIAGDLSLNDEDSNELISISCKFLRRVTRITRENFFSLECMEASFDSHPVANRLVKACPELLTVCDASGRYEGTPRTVAGTPRGTTSSLRSSVAAAIRADWELRFLNLLQKPLTDLDLKTTINKSTERKAKTRKPDSITELLMCVALSSGSLISSVMGRHPSYQSTERSQVARAAVKAAAQVLPHYTGAAVALFDRLSSIAKIFPSAWIATLSFSCSSLEEIDEKLRRWETLGVSDYEALTKLLSTALNVNCKKLKTNLLQLVQENSSNFCGAKMSYVYRACCRCEILADDPSTAAALRTVAASRCTAATSVWRSCEYLRAVGNLRVQDAGGLVEFALQSIKGFSQLEGDVRSLDTPEKTSWMASLILCRIAYLQQGHGISAFNEWPSVEELFGALVERRRSLDSVWEVRLLVAVAAWRLSLGDAEGAALAASYAATESHCLLIASLQTDTTQSETPTRNRTDVWRYEDSGLPAALLCDGDCQQPSSTPRMDKKFEVAATAFPLAINTVLTLTPKEAFSIAAAALSSLSRAGVSPTYQTVVAALRAVVVVAGKSRLQDMPVIKPVASHDNAGDETTIRNNRNARDEVLRQLMATLQSLPYGSRAIAQVLRENPGTPRASDAEEAAALLEGADCIPQNGTTTTALEGFLAAANSALGCGCGLRNSTKEKRTSNSPGVKIIRKMEVAVKCVKSTESRSWAVDFLLRAGMLLDKWTGDLASVCQSAIATLALRHWNFYGGFFLRRRQHEGDSPLNDPCRQHCRGAQALNSVPSSWRLVGLATACDFAFVYATVGEPRQWLRVSPRLPLAELKEQASRLKEILQRNIQTATAHSHKSRVAGEQWWNNRVAVEEEARKYFRDLMTWQLMQWVRFASLLVPDEELQGAKSTDTLSPCWSDRITNAAVAALRKFPAEATLIFQQMNALGIKLRKQAKATVQMSEARGPLTLALSPTVKFFSSLPWNFLLPNVSCVTLAIDSTVFAYLCHRWPTTHEWQPKTARKLCVVNPGGDLSGTSKSFPSALQDENLVGWFDEAPPVTAWVEELSNANLFVYCGHGSGGPHLPARAVGAPNKGADIRAVVCLFGCSSVKPLESDSDTEEVDYAAALQYLSSGSPSLFGLLWDVTTDELDRQIAVGLGEWAAGDGKWGSLSNAMLKARIATKLPLLTGAAMAILGLPV